MHAEGFFYFLVSPASLLVATLSESLSTSLSVVLFNRCGGHLPPFEPRGKSAVTQSTLPELATLEPAMPLMRPMAILLATFLTPSTNPDPVIVAIVNQKWSKW
ncbi:hypothetical protein F5883DRAFT_539455 [Diaporthe sp. PMI_573]|nr:hypothetical protein F5883DRAFT_539455 [Diaporthaceae sp. PMI_573]